MTNELVIYEGPDQGVIADPTAAQLSYNLLSRPLGYWRQGSGEAALRVGRRPGDQRKRSHAIVGRDGKPIAEYLAGYPELWVTQPEPGAFFVIWAEGTWFVPYDRSGREGVVIDERCGEPFKVPRSCLVDGAGALRIAEHFLHTRERLPSITWSPWDDVEPDDGHETAEAGE